MPGTEGNPSRNTNTLARRFSRLFRGAVICFSAFAIVALALCVAGPAAADDTCTGTPIPPLFKTEFCVGRTLYVTLSQIYRRPDGTYCTRSVTTKVSGGTCNSNNQGYRGLTVIHIPSLPSDHPPPWKDGTVAPPPDEGKPEAATPQGGGIKFLTPAEQKLRAALQKYADLVTERKEARRKLKANEQALVAALQRLNETTGFSSLADAEKELQRMQELSSAASLEMIGYITRTNDDTERLNDRIDALDREIRNGQKGTPEYDDAVRARNQAQSELQAIKDRVNELTQAWEVQKGAADRFSAHLGPARSAADQVAKAEGKIDSLGSQINLVQDEIDSLLKAATKAASQSTGSQNQIKTGLPVDATVFDRTGPVRWWTDGGLSRVDDRSAIGITGLQGRVMGGFDVLLDDLIGVTVGAGFSTSNADTAAGGTLKSNGISFAVRGYRGVTRDFWFDATAGYNYDLFSSTLTAVTDKYNVHQFSLGAGINATRALNQHWSLYGRLGWDGALTQRAASTDSANVTTPSETTNFGQATATGRLTYRFGKCELFAEGTLRYVTNDTSSGNFTAHPVDGTIGGGARVRLSEKVSLSGNIGYLVGRSDYDLLSARLYLVGSF